MPPTDCFDGVDHGGSSLASCVAEARQQAVQLLPTTKSPLHHGTDPDLSAPTPLTAGVAAAGLDLSPLSAGTCGLAVSKRKLRHTVHISPKPTCGARGSPQDTRDESQAKRAATLEHSASGCSPPPCLPSLGPRAACAGLKRRTTVSLDQQCGVFESSHAATGAAPMRSSVGVRHTKADNERYGWRGNAARSGTRSLEIDESVPKSVGQQAPPSLGPLCSKTGRASGVALDNPSRSFAGARTPLLEESNSKRSKLEAMMAKAKVVSDNILLLLHAKSCDGINCKEAGCASARILVEHMRQCRGSQDCRCSNAKCSKAHKMLRHYAECSEKRMRGGRYCLVCSLVARAANTCALSVNEQRKCPGASTPLQCRQPLGHLAPGSAPRRGPIVRTLRECTSRSLGCIQPPVAISRLKKGDWAQKPPPSSSARGSPISIQRKDGVFFRPLPKARSGSWGGYDRRGFLRRSRFDSIPEELAEEEAEDDNREAETTEAALKSEDANRSKTFVSSLSL